MGRKQARMRLTNKFLAKSVLVTGNFLAMKKATGKRENFPPTSKQ